MNAENAGSRQKCKSAELFAGFEKQTAGEDMLIIYMYECPIL